MFITILKATTEANTYLYSVHRPNSRDKYIYKKQNKKYKPLIQD